MSKQLFYFLFFLFITIGVNGQTVPDGYYDGTDELTGEELKLKLHQIIRNHTVRSYSEFRDTILPDLDEDPENPDNLIVFYKNASVPKSDFAEDDDSWNREHTWPSSHGFSNESDTAYTDAHNLRPSDASVNSSKSNKDFNDVENIEANAQGEAPDTYTDEDFWDPRDEIKGDVARILFYMDTRYESNRLNLELVDRESFSSDPELGVLYTLIKWHEEDPVDQYEIDRHEGIYGYQGNRNPFIDHPEWVAELWGSTATPSILINQESFSPDFGSVELGSSKVQSYGINAYNLASDLIVEVSAPFSLSMDGSTFSNNITFTNSGAEVQSFAVFLKYEPLVADEQVELEVTHSSGDVTVAMTVTGNEGALPVISIEEARTRALGEVVTVTGVVIDAGNNNDDSRVIYDGTAGVVVRSFDVGNESENLNLGDSILVTGGLSEYNDLLQIEESPITITLLKSNAVLPSPQEVTLDSIDEAFESELVVIRNVTFDDAGGTFQGGGSAGNFGIEDCTGSLIFRVGSSSHPLVGTTVPAGTYDITGFVGQFQSDYQISVRSVDDLVQVDDIDCDAEEVVLITIAEAREKPLGQVVTVTGVVISDANNSADNRVLYDGTAGIVVRSFDTGNESANLVIGDSITVTGGLLDYQGLLEIEESPITIQLHKQNASLPEAQPIAADEVGEPYESEMVVLSELRFVENGTFERGNYTLTDGTSQLGFRIGSATHPLVGTAIPSGMVELTGFVTENSDGYFVMVNDADGLDVTEVINSLEAQNLVKVYPNPTSEQVMIQGMATSSIESVMLYSLAGQEVMVLEDFSNMKLDIKNLDPGHYFLEIVDYSGSTVKVRVIKK